MSKNCPKCGKEVPDNAKFCMDCGYSFNRKSNSNEKNIFTNGSIFLILIAFIIVIGGIFILMTGFGGGDTTVDDANVEHVDLTITGVDGWDSTSGKKSYTLYTEALFNSVPNDLKGYIVKTTYYDSNDTQIGYETEKLDEIYYDSSYSISFAHYTTYKLPDPDHVDVEIIKDGKVIDTFTEQIDTNKISYLN